MADFPDTLPSEEISDDALTTQGTSQDDFPATLDPREFSAGASQPDFPDTISPDEFDASSHTATTSGAAARGVVEGAAPAIGGLGAGIAAGAGIGSLFAPGPGTAVGAVVGGVAAGMGAGWLISKGQDWALDMMGLRSGEGMLSRSQQETDEAQHPYAKFAGEMAPAAVLLRPGGSMGQRALGAGIGAAATAGTDYLQTGHVDPIKAAMGGAFGAALPSTNRLGNKFAGGEPTPPERPPPGLTQDGSPPPGSPGSPSNPMHGEVITPEQKSLEYQNTGKYRDDIESAVAQRDSFAEGDPMRDFWQTYIHELQSREDGKGGVDVDASLGPASDQHPFTYRDADRANDITTTALGVAADNHPAPQIEGAGNPVGAPMESRVAQRPTGLLRDYRKEAPASRGEVVTQESTRISQAPIHEDVAAALKGEQPEVSTAATPQLNEQGLSQAMAEPPPRGPIAMQPEPGQVAQPAAPLRAPGKPVTEAVTPQEQKVTNAARKALTDAGMDQVLAKLESLPPKEQAVAATKLLTALQSKTGEATGAGSEGEVRMPGKRPELPTGVTARSKADAARKQGVLDAYEKAAEKHGTGPEGEQSGALLDRLKNLVNTADELSGGATYRPNVKPAAWQLVQAARKVLAKPTPKNIEAFRSTEATIKGGDEGARLTQETARIEGDIEHRPQMSDAATENLTSHAQDQPRPEHEHFTNDNGDESAVYTGQHNNLTNWLNGLSDANHALLTKEHPDIALDVKTTQDPHELMNNYMDDLTRMQKAVAQFDAVPAENAPVTKRTPIKSRDDLAATEPGAPASKGKVLDKNSPAFKAAAEAAINASKKKPTYSLEHEEAQQRLGRENPIDGTDRTLTESMRAFMSDESGSVPLDKFARQAADWMKSVTKGFFHPRADKAAMDYGSQIGMRGVKLRTDIARAKAEVLANARASTEDTLTPMEKGRMYRAAERGDSANLPADLKKHYDTYWKPLLEKVGTAYDELRDLSQKNMLPGWDTMPERTNNGRGYMEWMPRRQITDPNGRDDSFEPITNKSSLSNWAASAQERDWFTLQDMKTGDRKVYRVNDDGKMMFYQNHNVGKAKVPPSGFAPREIGSELQVGPNRFKVDHSTIDELMTHGNGENGKPLKYSDNPGYVLSDAYVGLKSALYRAKLLDAILNDPDFSKMSTTKNAIADQNFGKGNHAETILPQLAGRHFPKPVAWALDDLVKTGFNYADNSFADKAARFAQATLKPFYFLGPEVHVFNEADKYIVLNGLNHANVPREVKSFGQAIQSVRKQDGVQAEIMDAGGNPMFMHALTSRIMPQVAKLVGEDLMRQKWKYDPLMKAFGVNSRELSSELYQGSNKFMWWQSDVLYTATYLQHRAQGLSPADAVKKTEHIIDSYVMPTTVGKSIGLEGSDAGRALQKFLTDPLTALFGRFHYGLYSGIAQVVKNLVGVNGMKGMANGAAQAALMTGMYMAIYPALSSGYSKITGNPDSEFEKRGATRLVGTAVDALRGKKHDQDLLRNVWTPSTVAQATHEQIMNRDWTGKEIANQPYGTPEGAISNVGRRAERAAQTLVSPYGTFARSLETPGVDNPKFALQRFLESNVGLKTPSPGAARYEHGQDKHDQSNMRSNRRKPGGLIERGSNWLTE